MRVRSAIALSLLFAGCAASPIAFRLDVAGPASAHAVVRSISGTTDTSPVECDTPCALTFEPDTAYEIELRAPGHRLARLPLEYGVVAQYERSEGENPRMVVPLLPE